MASKRMLEQQWEDYAKVLGEYDAAADFYNYQADQAKSGAQAYWVPTKPIEEQRADWESRQADFAARKAADPTFEPPTYLAGPFKPEYQATAGSDTDGNILVQHGKERVFTWRPDQSDSYVGDGGLTYLRSPSTGNYLPVFPDRPVEPDITAPNFTRAEQGKLATEDMTPALAERQAGKSTIQRTGAGEWSPFAGSNAGDGILMRVLKGKL